jgi:tetratricopeptide (TPR) repeat protein
MKKIIILSIGFCLFSCGDAEKKGNKETLKQGIHSHDGKSIYFSTQAKDAIYYYNQGVLSSQKEDYDSALKFYNRAIAMDSTYASSYNARGTIKYLFLNDSMGALKDYQRAIELDSTDASFYNDIGVLLDDFGKEQEGMSYYLKAIKIDSTYSLSYCNLGILFYDKEDYQQALSYFEKYLIYEKNDPYPLYYMGMCHKILGNKDKAKYYLISARNAGSPEAMLELKNWKE